MTLHEVDVVVLGLGPGGEYAAHKLSEAGLDVVGVEQGLVGGECPFYGCIPSKMMVRAADALAEARRANHLAGEVDVRPDWGPVARRIDKQATNHWNDESHVKRLEGVGVRIVRGHGSLAGPGRVVVDGTSYAARRGVVVATGTCPAVPDIDGLADTPFLTNREIVRTTELPESLAVIGGGPIGVELAQAFARFGSRVTVIEAEDRILGPEEPEAAAVVARVFRDEGIEVVTDVDIDRVTHDGSFHVHLDGRTVTAQQLLVAAGRDPQIHDIGLETVGLDPEASHVEVDDRLRAGERLWAVGDITGVGAWTHLAMYQARVAVRDLLGQGGPAADYRALSRVTFTDPEVGSVGLTERAAREEGRSVVTAVADLAESSRGWIRQVGNEGVVKLVADADRQVLVGGTVVGPSGGEVLGLLTTAIHAEVPLETLRGMHFAYPTFHRAIQGALDDLG
ncbi:dihydrolipoyl dehydrogenase family protein [Nocardioides sp. GCM10027113]|uniref:dihydrolipoyl dehydrogenase family protein n=1 Tax=unclassified Nocardioides TaxID=2615069 RepID=UPI00361A4209